MQKPIVIIGDKRYEVLDYRFPNQGDRFLYRDVAEVACSRFTNDRHYIVRELPAYPALAAGEWNTVKPDGTPGPVVTLRPMRIKDTGMQALVPFEADVPPLKSYYVTVDGVCVRFHDAGDRLRITTPCVKPSPLERLKKWRDQTGFNTTNAAELDGIIAEMEKA